MVYVPRNKEVLAVWWDGSDDAFEKIIILCKLVGRECVGARGALCISVPTEQRSEMLVEPKRWIVFGPPHGVMPVDADVFEAQYMKVR